MRRWDDLAAQPLVADQPCSFTFPWSALVLTTSQPHGVRATQSNLEAPLLLVDHELTSHLIRKSLSFISRTRKTREDQDP